MIILRKQSALFSGTIAICLAVLWATARADTTSHVTLDVANTYIVTSSGSANLSVGASNFNDIGEYNFIGDAAPTYGAVSVHSNVAWTIRAALNLPMPTSPGGGYTLRVDDDRTVQNAYTGWSAPLTNSNSANLSFVGSGSPGAKSYNLDWRIEGLTEEDGTAPLSRTVTFTIFGSGIV
jgi:hypothetical protein